MSGESLELASRGHGVCPEDGTGDVVRCERCPFTPETSRPRSIARAVRDAQAWSERCGVSIVRGVEPPELQLPIVSGTFKPWYDMALVTF